MAWWVDAGVDNVSIFHNLVHLAASDGKFTDEEVQFLASQAEQWGIPDEEFETALAGLADGEIQIQLPDSKQQRVELLSHMLRLMAADGELAEIEKRLCATASARMGFSTQQFQNILDGLLRKD